MTIEYNNYIKNLRDDDVMEIDNQLFKAEKIKSSLEEAWTEKIVPERFNEHIKYLGIKIRHKGINWFDDGVDCKILKAGDNGWKKGKLKVKVSVEFIPDEPEIPEYKSPLDEIRNHPSFSTLQ